MLILRPSRTRGAGKPATRYPDVIGNRGYLITPYHFVVLIMMWVFRISGTTAPEVVTGSNPHVMLPASDFAVLEQETTSVP